MVKQSQTIKGLSDENNKNSVIYENEKLNVTVSHMWLINSELKELYTDKT